jgi:hypothetical protein
MKVEVASLTSSRDGWFLEVREYPLYALLAERVGYRVCDATGRLCVVPYVYRPFNWMCGGFGTWKRTKHLYSIPVTVKWAREHYPDAIGL